MNKYYLFLLVGLIICGCNDKSVQPEESRQYKIAFTYSDSTGGKLVTVNRDGSDLKKVYNLRGTTFDLSWAPDGSKLAMDVYGVDIEVVNIYDSEHKLFRVGLVNEYSWFEDSKRIAFSTNDTIYSIDIIANTQKLIGLGSEPEVSPNGDKIAFLRNSSLYIMNSDGTGETHLTDSVWAGLKWSPNGDKVAFVGFNRALYLISSNGTDKILLTPEGNVGTQISWSPDGTQLTYSQIYGVGVVNSDGTGNKIIAVNAYSPDWCRDGSVIIFNSSELGLIMVKPDGTDSTQVVSIKSDFSFSWSPLPLPYI